MIRYLNWRTWTSDDGVGIGFQLYRLADTEDGGQLQHLITWPYATWSIRAGEWGLDPVADAETIWAILEGEHDHERRAASPLWTPDAELDLVATRTQHLKEALATREMHAARRPRVAPSASDLARHQDTLRSFLAAQPVSYELAAYIRERTQRDHRERMRQRLVIAHHHGEDPMGFQTKILRERREAVK